MERLKNISDLDKYMAKGAKTIYYIFLFLSCTGYLVDFVNFHNAKPSIIFFDLPGIGIPLIVFFLYLRGIVSFRNSFGIMIYAGVFAILLDNLSDTHDPQKIDFFFRDSLFIISTVTVASLFIGRIHGIIITLLYIVTAIALNLIVEQPFLRSSLAIIIISNFGYAFIIYYVVGIIEKTITEREKNSQLIKMQNHQLNETNALLEERQQQVEEQSEELQRQTEILLDQSNLLSVKNSELEQSNKTKDKFISILAHDLKSPFHIILGFADLLEADYAKLDDSKRQKYIRTLGSTAHKTYNLLENLLQWARSQTNSMEFNPRKIALNAILKQNLYFSLENYKNKKIELVEDIVTDAYVTADENMMDTVIRNILSNAIKFTSSGGKIYAGCKKENGKITVDITDTGIGMDQETLQCLFKIDRNFSTMGTMGETGTGLGLIICKDFVEKNGGSISVTSVEGKGSSFVLSLPAC